MARWQTAAAKQNFSKLVTAAASGGPQLVLRHNDPVAVVMSPDDYRTLVRQANAGLARLLMSCPLEDGDVGKISMKFGAADFNLGELGDAA